jgi:hypothetical protein
MSDDFQSDVLFSHCAKDQVVVRPLAERKVRAARRGALLAMKVWFDEFELPVASVYDRLGEGRLTATFSHSPRAKDCQSSSRASGSRHKRLGVAGAGVGL